MSERAVSSAQPSFAADIAPMLAPYRPNMMWRFDLADYDAVKANATIIRDQIAGGQMPPPPLPPFSARQIALFTDWVVGSCPP